MWQVFAQPLFEFTLPLYFYEEATIRKEKVRVCLRNSFKSFTSIKKMVNIKLIEDLMGYDLDERSKEIFEISHKKWDCRKEGKLYSGKLMDNGRSKALNWCKNMPKSMIKYVNMQNALCPHCKDNNISIRCSKFHLEAWHGWKIDDIQELVLKVADTTKKLRSQRSEQTEITPLKRADIVEYAESIIQPNIDKLKEFLNMKSS